MKKLTAFICSLILLLVFTGCGESDTVKTAHSSGTLYGKVLSIDGNKATVVLGTMDMKQMQPPENAPMPDEKSGPGGNQPGGQDGDMPAGNPPDGTPPQEENAQGGEAPQGKPDGVPPEAGSDGVPPMAGSDGNIPEGFPGGQPNAAAAFTAGDETITIDIGDITVEEGGLLEIVFDANGDVSSVKQFPGPMDSFGINEYGSDGSASAEADK